MKKLLLSVALLGLTATAPASAFTYSKILPSNVSFIVEPTDITPVEIDSGVKIAQGISSMLPGPGTVHSVSATYVGLGNVKVATAYWSLRPYSAAKATALAPLFNLCDGNLLNCNDIRATAAGGRNAADMALNSCDTSGLCQIKIIYEQTGSGQPDLQFCVTTLGCPLLLPTGSPGGKPVGAPNLGVANVTGTITSIPTPWSMSLYLTAITPSAGSNVRVFTAPDPTGILCCNTGHWELFGTGLVSASASITANTFYTVQGGIDAGGNGFICQDATCDPVSPGSAAISGAVGTNWMGGGGANSSFTEIAIFGSLNNSTEQTNIKNNIAGYW